ncbi:hypothetical protein B9Z19DRAFT_1066953 [Tuber borchii]|uniref:Phosphatidylinositol transfer protein SFH5 n=1 Tax=Tuber borchii TaxID=42251 RepID=A0A2T6ZKK9_TUBBO|nr:hypothetical protein B9Z19DRAFT_1066953 [Tuber borchii]
MKSFVNVPLLMGWVFSAMNMIFNKDSFKKLYMLTCGASLAGELNSETVPESYGGKGAKLATKGMTIGLDGQLIQLEVKGVESGDVGIAVATEAPKEEPAQVKEETEGSKVPEESGVAEEPQVVEEPEHTEEHKETVGVGQTNETGEAIKQGTPSPLLPVLLLPHGCPCLFPY